MYQATFRAAATAAVVLHAASAFAQTTVVDFRNLRPREVKSAVFSVTTARDFRVDAIGAESSQDAGTFAWVTAMWKGNAENREPWMGNAWILDTRSRQVVWELSAASTSRGHRSTRVFGGTVHLAPGSYEAFYASFPDTWSVGDDEAGTGQRLVSWLANQGFDEFRLTIQGNARPLAEADAGQSRRTVESGALVALRGDGGERFTQAGFILDRPTELDVYATGEARENAEFDAGWIINADTRQTVWKLSWRDSAPAGGARKNRMAHIKKTLPPGRYAAFYATDDSHDASAWNAPPPHDPHAWGLFIRVTDPAARAAVKTFDYEHVPASAVIAALTKVGDDESLSKRFTLDRAAEVRVYALGEGTSRLVDYGWITNAATGQKVWEMRLEDTESAGGDSKNRLVDRTIRLEKGAYILHYTSDDSHAYNQWNAAAPRDGARWGITVLATSGGR
jgi:hypothetical protein